MINFNHYWNSEYDLTENFLLTPEQIEYDIELLIFYLCRAYAGIFWFSDADFQSTFKLLRSIKQSNLDRRALGVAIAKALENLQDAHLTVALGNEYLGSRNLSSSEGSGTVGENIANTKTFAFSLEKRSDKKVAFLGISKFEQPEHNGWNGWDEAINAIFKCDALVVDLRGNKGGNDLRAYELATRLVGREIDGSWYDEVFLQTPETFQLQINTCLQRLLTMCMTFSRCMGFPVSASVLKFGTFNAAQFWVVTFVPIQGPPSKPPISKFSTSVVVCLIVSHNPFYVTQMDNRLHWFLFYLKSCYRRFKIK